ncbi:MAG TPA: pantoate--beta-alanine ligase [Candidatus Limnocylindria bacterium]|nr:pantoate--beta-alanine ligase [Candidatus Limnocylindria bacterium]
MKVLRTVAEVREAVREPRRRGERIGLVPTMGAFHAGHMALIRAAREASDVVVVSLFVNPTQFDAAEDLARYPKDEASDAQAAEAEGVDLLFAPTADELFPPGFDTWVDPGELGTVLEGAARPGHFRGVATVCTKLFSIVEPDIAWFGQKDAQQVAVIRRVVSDLNLRPEIRVVETVRDADGLALSSRNMRLSPAEREAALVLPRSLEAGLVSFRAGGDAEHAARQTLIEAGADIDYVAAAQFDRPTLVAAIRVGSTRLIDNVVLEKLG